MRTKGLVEATGLGIFAAAALAAPAAAHHDTRDCNDWRGHPVVESDGVGSVELQSITFWDVCGMAPGAGVVLADGRQVTVVARRGRVVIEHTGPRPARQPAYEAPESDDRAEPSRSKKRKRRCKGRKSGSKSAKKRCR